MSEWDLGSRVWYPEGIAPFGEMNIASPHVPIGPIETAGTASDFYLPVRRITDEAWGSNPWIRNAIDYQLGSEWRDAGYGMLAIAEESLEVAIASVHKSDQAGSFAILPPREETDPDVIPIDGMGPHVLPSQVVGWSNAKLDVSGTPLQQTFKRYFRPEKVYGAVPNIDVLPAYQFRNIGAALLYVSLGYLPPEKKCTTDVPSLNSTLITKLGLLGFEPTGEQERSDLLFEGVTIMETRLQAPSVQGVRQALTEKYDWLEQGIQRPLKY